MTIKKLNACFSLLTTVLLIMHVAYNAFCYFTMYYNPAFKWLFSTPLMATVLVHSVFGMLSVFLFGDGDRPMEDLKKNWKTVVQRTAASLFFPLLFLHIQSFDLYKSSAETNNIKLFVTILIVDIVFYYVITLHVSLSVSKALTTLGIITTDEVRRVVDNIALTIGLVVVTVATVIIVRGMIIMFFVTV